MHAATFGGNPLAARAGIAALEMIEQENLLENGLRLGEVFRQRFTELAERCPLVSEVRVAGCMIGIDLKVDGTPAVQACLERQLLINCTHGHVIRLLPALNLSVEQAHEGCDILCEVLERMAG
jgi:acetylornithine/succinyldiaminopimelate/putrescine aminotransferase